MKKKNIISVVISVLLTCYFTLSPFYRNRNIISKNDEEYMLKELDNMTAEGFHPVTPQNETQSVMSNFMQDLNKLILETNEKVTSVGTYVFSTFTELNEKAYVSELKGNLKKYRDIKKAYYGSMDNSLREFVKKLNGSEQDLKVALSNMQLDEKTDFKYFIDLNEFYEFILKYHEIITFEDQLILQDQSLVNKVNTLWDKVVKSSAELTAAENERALN